MQGYQRKGTALKNSEPLQKPQVSNFVSYLEFSLSRRVHKLRVFRCLNMQQPSCSLKRGNIPRIPATLMIKSAAIKKTPLHQDNTIYKKKKNPPEKVALFHVI